MTPELNEYLPFPHPSAPDANWVTWANTWPTVSALGMRCTRMDRAGAVFVVDSDPFVPNPNGTLNGGIVAAMIDQVLGTVAARGMGVGCSPRTGTLAVQYHGPVTVPMTLRATVLPGGRRVRFIEVHIECTSTGRSVSAQGTMVVVGPP